VSTEVYDTGRNPITQDLGIQTHLHLLIDLEILGRALGNDINNTATLQVDH